jgi:hypothetical protein
LYVVQELSQVPIKGERSTNTNMLQLQVDEWRGTSSLQKSRLQSLKGQNAKDKAAKTVQDHIEQGVLFQHNHLWYVLHGSDAQHTAKATASATPGAKGLPRHSGRNECPASL